MVFWRKKKNSKNLQNNLAAVVQKEKPTVVEAPQPTLLQSTDDFLKDQNQEVQSERIAEAVAQTQAQEDEDQQPTKEPAFEQSQEKAQEAAQQEAGNVTEQQNEQEQQNAQQVEQQNEQEEADIVLQAETVATQVVAEATEDVADEEVYEDAVVCGVEDIVTEEAGEAVTVEANNVPCNFQVEGLVIPNLGWGFPALQTNFKPAVRMISSPSVVSIGAFTLQTPMSARLVVEKEGEEVEQQEGQTKVSKSSSVTKSDTPLRFGLQMPRLNFSNNALGYVPPGATSARRTGYGLQMPAGLNVQGLVLK